MGCFDTIKCKYKLPNGKTDVEEQTKAFDSTMSYLTIREDGQIIVDMGHSIEHKKREEFPNTITGIFAYQDSLEWVPNVVESTWNGSLEVDEFVLWFVNGKVKEVVPITTYSPFFEPVTDPAETPAHAPSPPTPEPKQEPISDSTNQGQGKESATTNGRSVPGLGPGGKGDI